MYSLFKFSAAAVMAVSAPALAQTVAVPSVGSENGMSNMPKTTATIPDRVRTMDPNSPDGIRVRSDLADQPGESPQVSMPREHF